MAAIAPPPVGYEVEPSVQLDNAHALAALEGAARGSPTRARRRSLGVGLGLGAAALLVGALAAGLIGRRRSRPRSGVWREPSATLAAAARKFATLGAYVYATSRTDRPFAPLVAPALLWLGLAGAIKARIVAKKRGRFAGAFAGG